MKTMVQKTVVAVTVGTLMFGAAMAQDAEMLPPVQTSGEVEYLSGGVGKDEATAIKRASQQWPLALEFAVKNKQHAYYTADVKVVVRDSKGNTVLETTADGPFLLAKLPAGRYAVEATLADKTLKKQVLVKNRQTAKALFLWPPGMQESQS